MERLQGKKSIWDTLSKTRLKTFEETLKRTSVKLKDKVANLKQDRKMMTRLIIASRKREEIDLPHYLGTHEFSVVPLSMFDYNGNLLIDSRDKSSIMHGIEKLLINVVVPVSDMSSIAVTPTPSSETKNVIIFDAMAVVQAIKKNSSLKTVKDFAESFKARILEASDGFGQVRVIFDRYLSKSLKNQTKVKRTGKKLLQYKVDDNTSIVKVELKDLLSHIYLSNYVDVALESANKEYCVVYETHCKTNISDFHIEMLEHNQEEADTIIILHSIDIARKDRSTKLTIVSPDTEVFLVLIYTSTLIYAPVPSSELGKKIKQGISILGVVLMP